MEDDTVERQFEDAEEDKQTDDKPRDGDAGDTQFCPPLYRQRYCLVASILRKENVTKVADFGSSECKVLPIFKCVDSLEDIIGVDLDKTTLKSGIYFTKPLLADYLFKRSRPLKIRLLCGNIAEYDARLHGVEAVTLIEVIEHLYPDTIREVTRNIFENIRPRIVVMTTPNSEYNVVFPGDPRKFRHWDHKFEWTRSEFSQWCDDVASRHGYTVEYSGVGDPPRDKLDVGHCSQVALFRLDSEWAKSQNPAPSQEQPYEQIAECIHPYREVPPLHERIVTETNFYLKTLVSWCLDVTEDELISTDKDKFSYSEQDNTLKVSLSFLLTLSQFQKLAVNEETLRSVLLSEKFHLTKDGQHIFHTPPTNEEWSSDDDWSENGDLELPTVLDAPAEQENWDI